MTDLSQVDRDTKGGPWNSVDAGRRDSNQVTATSYLSPWPCDLDREASSTSQINDHGDAGYLDHQQRPSCDYFRIQAEVDFAATGVEKFPDPQPNLNGDDISLGDDSPLKSTPRKLGDEIRRFSAQTASVEKKYFYPIHALEQVVTRNRARDALGALEDCQMDHNTVIDHIFEKTTHFGHTTRRLKIFVILALLYKSEAIVDFIKQGIYDVDLPFEARRLADGQSQLFRNPQIEGRDSQEPIILPDGWTQNDVEDFENKQYHVCIPFFNLSTDDPKAKVPHYNLREQIILPFIEDDEGDLGIGGFGEVWRVRLHESHHNLSTQSAVESNPYFAVKKLKHADEKAAQAFRKEVSALNRFSNQDHPNLIKLLCTYRWRDHYYFLFPWADGNLDKFWKTYPDPPARLKNPSTARWLSTEHLGLARALRDIHNGSLEGSTRDQGRNYADPARKHGKHGDVKPENILYFGPKEDGDDPLSAHFKISDFGLAEYHTTRSLNVEGDKVARTPTYMAPELDIMNGSTPRYDIWSFACVLLEHTAWYLCGFSEVEKFSTERANEDGFDCRLSRKTFEEDVFYKYINVPIKGRRGEEPSLGAISKRSVTEEINRLLEHEDCSDYILDLLLFIKQNLLRMNPGNRASCEDIVRKFEEFHQNCIASDDYCVKKLKRPPTRSRTDSSLLVDGDMSPEQRRKLETLVMQNQQIHFTRITTTEHITVESVSSMQPNTELPATRYHGPLYLGESEGHDAEGQRASEKSHSTKRTAKPETLSVPDGTDDGGSTFTANTLRADQNSSLFDDPKLPVQTQEEKTRQRGRLKNGLSRIWGKWRSVSRTKAS